MMNALRCIPLSRDTSVEQVSVQQRTVNEVEGHLLPQLVGAPLSCVTVDRHVSGVDSALSAVVERDDRRKLDELPPAVRGSSTVLYVARGCSSRQRVDNLLLVAVLRSK